MSVVPASRSTVEDGAIRLSVRRIPQPAHVRTYFEEYCTLNPTKYPHGLESALPGKYELDSSPRGKNGQGANQGGKNLLRGDPGSELRIVGGREEEGEENKWGGKNKPTTIHPNHELVY